MPITMCFTGHRNIVPIDHTGPPWPDQSNIVHNYHMMFVETLTNILRQLNDVNYTTFISGGALGADQLAAQAVINLKAEGREAHLVIAKPFPGQDRIWPAKSKAELQRLCNLADEVYPVSAVNPENKQDVSRMMQDRNIHMVDRSDTVMSIWNGTKRGGTWNCIQYAVSQGKIPWRLNPYTFELAQFKKEVSV